MAPLEAFAPNYRRARECWPDAPMLASCHDALCACFEGGAHSLVDHVKSFIESVCVTILNEFGEPIPARPAPTELLVAALRPLGLQNTRGSSKLDKVLSGFNRLSDALSDMRDEHGVVAHGKDGFLDSISIDHARAFLYAGDAILSILLNALEGKEPNLTATREPYDRFPHLNERIDRAVGIEVKVDHESGRPIVLFAVRTANNEPIELRMEPSRLLYGIDRAAYVEVLKAAAVTVEEPEDVEDVSEEIRPSELSNLRIAPETPPVAELVPEYAGSLSFLKVPLEQLLSAEGLQAEGQIRTHLTESLLATADENMGLDWQARPAIQARMRVALRRVLQEFGVETPTEVAEGLVKFFQAHAITNDAEEL